MNNKFDFRFEKNEVESRLGIKDSLYLPAVSAILHDRLDIGSLDPHSPQVAALMVRNGLIPDQAGAFNFPCGRVGVYDLVSGRKDGDSLIVKPLEKSAVNPVSRQIENNYGIVTLSNLDEGTVRPIAEVADPVVASWDKRFRIIGGSALRMLGLNTQTYEVSSIEPGGELISKIPKRYF